ncbi:MAG: IS21-like element helper ATPase IstB [Mangrovibacterium sp.]
MNEQIKQIKQLADTLRLTLIRNKAEAFIHSAQIDQPSYLEYTQHLLEQEVGQRQRNDLERRVKLAKLPLHHNLENYNYKVSSSITPKQMGELREMLWVDQVYNLVLMGPSGTGKSFIAAGLINDAVAKGYKAYFTTMEDLINILRTKELTSTALSSYNRYLKAHLIAIDDIMLFPIKKNEAVALFNLINHLHEQCSLIITTNKSPKQWAESMEDEVLATALLDRILYRCEVIKLDGMSYRMENRKNIFSDK